ncbi:hypothetical protein GQ53DRAFT_756428 [Thozetella sp. PMI_491]|nr:hypothetical protein GQ53DRAFT_756428 [Thozetella sp. PMI_491]
MGHASTAKRVVGPKADQALAWPLSAGGLFICCWLSSMGGLSKLLHITPQPR